LLIKLDGTVIPLTDIRNRGAGRWYRITDAFNLDKGKHEIRIEGAKNFSGEVVFIPIKEKERLTNLYWQKIKGNRIKIGYLFSGTKENSLKNKTFNGLSSGNYFLSGWGHFKLSPVPEKKIIKEITLNTRDWLFTPERSEISGLQENGKEVVLKALFDGPGNEDEFIRVHPRHEDNLKIDLNEYPFLDLKYRIENPEVQTIEMVLKVGFDEEGKMKTGIVDQIFPGFPSKYYDHFSVDALDRARTKFPGKSSYTLKGIELFPHKKYGVDMTSSSQKEYSFYLGEIRFYKEETINKLLEKTYLLRETPGNFKDDSWSLTESKPSLIKATNGYIGFNIKPEKEIRISRNFKALRITSDQKLYMAFQVDEEYVKSALMNLKLFSFKNKKELLVKKFLNQKREGFQKLLLNLGDIISPAEKGPWGVDHIEFLLTLKDTNEKSDEEHLPFKLKELSIYSESKVSLEKALPRNPIGHLEAYPLNIRRDLKLGEWDRQYPFLGQSVQLSPKAYGLTWNRHEKIIIDSIALYPVGLPLEKKETEPKIDFKKINPTRYLVMVKKARKPFWLVFSESFHEGWKGYIRKGSGGEKQGNEPWSALWSAWKDRGRRIEIKEHFLVNGYANSWYVRPSQAEADQFDIILEFKPQRLFEIGVIISALTLLGCIGYLFASYIRRRSKKKNHEA
jgi:hypothetical protein